VFELIHAERERIPVARACRALGVSRSGFYQWLHRAPSPRSAADAALACEVAEVFQEHRGRYGAPRVRRALRRRRGGVRPSKKRVARVMKSLGLRARMHRRFRTTTDSRHTKRIAPNLLERDFVAHELNRVVAGDITYIATSDGWLYLAVLLDLYSRRVVGWAMSDRIDTELALAALHAAASTRALAPGWIHHTDRDCRYGSDDYLAALKLLHARPSMSRKGDCWDNAVSESFFATLEKELLAVETLQPRSIMRQLVADYIDNYYN
jgi:putative transposase